MLISCQLFPPVVPSYELEHEIVWQLQILVNTGGLTAFQTIGTSYKTADTSFPHLIIQFCPSCCL
jgi:hypothetical protein